MPEPSLLVLPEQFPPAWAGGWGEDTRGVYAELILRGVSCELRWIPPGTFRMGSPETEAGRWNDEGPQHLVTLTQGFWLANTPCTQKLWQVVRGDNPSRSKGEQRPVAPAAGVDRRVRSKGGQMVQHVHEATLFNSTRGATR